MKSKIYLLTLVVFLLAGCAEDFLDTAPENTISNQQLSESPSSLQAIVNGIYANLRTFGIGGATFHIDYGHVAMRTGLDMMANDVTQSVFHWYGFFANYDSRVQTSSRTRVYWNTYYSQIAEANSIINAIDETITDPGPRAILGQGLALRAFCMFQLARTYGPTYIGNESALGVPMPNGQDFEGKPRATLAQIYALIASDLEKSVDLLKDFSRTTKQEIDQSVAQGLLAEVYLEMGNWAGAAEMAAQARANYQPMSANQWLGGFSNIENPEWMWGADIDNESSTVFASFFSHFDNTSGGYAGILGVYKNIDARLYGMIPDTDVRKQAFVDPVNGNPEYPDFPGYANLKFRDATFFEGDYVYMRAAEMYLIEAEAKARLGDATAADVLYDLVSTRDPGYTKSTNTGDALVEEIYTQRRIELWGEGHSWFDLKRLNKPLERDYEGSNHPSFSKFNYPAGDNKFKWQLPEDEINANDAISLADQNPV